MAMAARRPAPPPPTIRTSCAARPTLSLTAPLLVRQHLPVVVDDHAVAAAVVELFPGCPAPAGVPQVLGDQALVVLGQVLLTAVRVSARCALRLESGGGGTHGPPPLGAGTATPDFQNERAPDRPDCEGLPPRAGREFDAQCALRTWRGHGTPGGCGATTVEDEREFDRAWSKAAVQVRRFPVDPRSGRHVEGGHGEEAAALLTVHRKTARRTPWRRPPRCGQQARSIGGADVQCGGAHPGPGAGLRQAPRVTSVPGEPDDPRPDLTARAGPAHRCSARCPWRPRRAGDDPAPAAPGPPPVRLRSGGRH